MSNTINKPNVFNNYHDQAPKTGERYQKVLDDISEKIMNAYEGELDTDETDKMLLEKARLESVSKTQDDLSGIIDEITIKNALDKGTEVVNLGRGEKITPIYNIQNIGDIIIINGTIENPKIPVLNDGWVISHSKSLIKKIKEKAIIKTPFESPTRGVAYTFEELFNKFFERGEIVFSMSTKRVSPESMYGDKDLLVYLTAKSTPQLQESVEVHIEGEIPLHVDYTGKISLGWATTCKDSKTGETYWSHHKNVPYHLQRYITGDYLLTAGLGDEEREWSIPYCDNYDEMTKAGQHLLALIKELLAREKAATL